MSWACSPDFSSKKKPLNDYCDKLYLSYQVGHTKPAPEIFDYMVNDCNIIPSETLFVDDGASNIQIGKELGFETFQPKNGEDWRERNDCYFREIIILITNFYSVYMIVSYSCYYHIY